MGLGDGTLSATSMLWLAFALGFLFGLVAQCCRFCTMGAIADVFALGDWRRMGMWWLAIAVAVLGSAALHLGGQIDLGKSIYRTPDVLWLSHLVGGFCFGFGMVLASGCAARTLVRIGSGSVKAVVVFLVLGLVAYMTLYGVLGVFRVRVLERVAIHLTGDQGLPTLLSGLGLAPAAAQLVPALTVGGSLLGLVFLQRNPMDIGQIVGGVVVGLIAVGGWYVSGHLGFLAEDPETLQEAFIATQSGKMESLSFVAPQAHLLDLLMLWSDNSRHLSFGVASVLGVVVGSLSYALACRCFRWEGFCSLEDTVNHLLGAALMGFGGVVAMGCTIGQGIVGLSTLALGSLFTLVAIVAGALSALQYQYRRAGQYD